MKCRTCSCKRYTPDDELVFDEWKLRLTEKDWDAAYFDDSERCLACGHTPGEHGGGGGGGAEEEATVVSIVHLTEQIEQRDAWTREMTKLIEFNRVTVAAAGAIAGGSCFDANALGTGGATAAVDRAQTLPGIWVDYKTETSFSEVGLQIWRSSVLVAEYLASWGVRKYAAGGVFWEVGAGVGLPGLLASAMGVRTWLTDNRASVVSNLSTIAKKNAPACDGRAAVKLFDFESKVVPVALAQRHTGWDPADLSAKVDLIVAADVIFDPHVTDLFLAFLAAQFDMPAGPRVCLLGYDRRSGQYITDGGHPVDDMLSKLALHSLAARDVPADNIPRLCATYERSPDVKLMIVTPAGQ